MAKGDQIEIQGVVSECLSNAMFLVKAKVGEAEQATDLSVLCNLSGKMRMNNIRVLPGDHVTVEMSPYASPDEKGVHRGRITFRHKVAPSINTQSQL